MTRAPGLRPDPAQAQEWLRRELAGAEYQPTLRERVLGWLSDLIDKVGEVGGRFSGLGWPVLLLILLVLLAVAALVLARVRRNPATPVGAASVFDDVRRSAVDHRRLAEAAFSDEDWDTALVESVRALTAGLVERGITPDDPTVTAREVTTTAGPRFPDLRTRLDEAALRFEETRYGGRAADRARAAACLELDRTLAATAPTAASGGPVLAVPR